jgi:hypothetical protein
MAAKNKYNGCAVCSRELLLYKCKYCNKAFCEEHRAPDKHQCEGMEVYRRQLAMGTIDRPGATVSDGPEEKHGRRNLPHGLFKIGVITVQLLAVIAVVIAIIFTLVLLLGYVDSQTPIVSVSIPVSNALGDRVVLANYKNATDPTYDNLTRFLITDTTNKINYTYPNFTCADFARSLHDKAEASGIKSGFVLIEFYNTSISYAEYDDGSGNFVVPVQSTDVGHGLNVFNTTDHGLVYVDVSSIRSGTDSRSGGPRIAYIEEGREFNEIPLAYASDGGYSFYESYKLHYLDYIRDLRNYNRDTAAFNAELNAFGGVVPTDRVGEMKQRSADLERRLRSLETAKTQIGPFILPQGIVKETATYW